MEIPERKNLLLDQIRRMATLQQFRQMPDRELLAQFAAQGNESAFRVLMDRYGPMVLRVCKRILGNDHDAEDAYQATFFVLASKAGSQRRQESVASWLHGVAVHTACKARRADQRRRLREQKAMERKAADSSADVSLRETCGILEEEIARLPQKYRTPLIQCELINRRQDEVARELGYSLPTLKRRLQGAKALLQKRMAARGLTLTSILLSLMLSPPSEAGAVPPELAANTLRNLLLFVRGQEVVATAPAVANPVAAKLAGLMIKGMLIAKIRGRALAIVLALVLAGASVQFDSPARGNPAYRSDVIQARYRIILVGKDGQFSLTVPAGPVQLLAHGPTHEYLAHALRCWDLLAEESERWGWRKPLPGEQRFYAHAEQDLKPTAAENPAEVRLQLMRGQAIAGRVVGLDGEPVQTAVLLCGEKVSPLRNGTALPLPVRKGRYELPGCVAERVYPVLFLDAVNRWGAAVDMMASSGAGSEVKLARCGSVRVRLVNARGRPLAGQGLRLALLTERSFPVDKPPLERAADGHYSYSYDPRNYSTDPVSDGEGWLTLPALIPGAHYVLEYADVKGVLCRTPEFRVEPGEQLQLPDLAIRDRK